MNPFYHDQYKYDEEGDLLLDGNGKPIVDKVAKYKAHHTMKTENTTLTADYHVDCSRTIGEVEGTEVVDVTHTLGNNGKLVFSAPVPDLDIPVQKQWVNVAADTQAPVTFTLYRVTPNGGVNDAEVVATYALNTQDGWTHIFENQQIPPEGENAWFYAIGETVPTGFVETYSGETITVRLGDGDNAQYVTAVKVTVADGAVAEVVIKNAPTIELPETGGSGTILYTTGGLLLMTVAVTLLLHNQSKKRRREGRPSF